MKILQTPVAGDHTAIRRSIRSFLESHPQWKAKRRTTGHPTAWVAGRAIKLDGTIVQIERAGVPLRTGNKVFAQGFVRDLTERGESRRRLSGHIFVESEVGTGTTFDIAIPVQR